VSKLPQIFRPFKVSSLNTNITHIIYRYGRIANFKINAIFSDTVLCIEQSRIRAQKWATYLTVYIILSIRGWGYLDPALRRLLTRSLLRHSILGNTCWCDVSLYNIFLKNWAISYINDSYDISFLDPFSKPDPLVIIMLMFLKRQFSTVLCLRLSLWWRMRIRLCYRILIGWHEIHFT
jgi:hypothetical protein